MLLSYITIIETAVPTFGYTQDCLSSFYMRSAERETDRRKIRMVAAKSGIDTRYSVIQDFEKEPEQFAFFPKSISLEPEPPLSKRMEIYRSEASKLSLDAIFKIKNLDTLKDKITHLITVTCTGLFAPGLDIEMIRALDLRPNIQRSSINFMGCNAAIIALKNADSICKNQPGAKVLIVCTELCTIHFQKNFTSDYILSNLLFGDGAAALVVSAEPENYHSNLIRIDRFDSFILHQGYREMAWQLSETGFVMNLTSYVSELINGHMKTMLDEISLDPSTITDWVIHPGGKRILDDFCEALALDNERLGDSYKVLREHGNMSSPTVLFVLKSVLENKAKKVPGQKVFSAAFGPGLSVETMQLSYV